MIIFGTSRKLFQLAVVTLVCGVCGNPAAHAVRKRVLRFSLFFVPLFPLAPAKFSTQCTFCGAEKELDREHAEGLVARWEQEQRRPAGGGVAQA